MRQSGPQYQGKDGKMVRPLAFMHPCRVPGCEREGCYGFGVRLLSKDVKMPGLWFCREHKDYLRNWEQDHPHEDEPAPTLPPSDDLFGR